jgi:aspartyl-tRNA(Asn)/glutamyl-tRNA(Gln) amidotransferase subunit B
MQTALEFEPVIGLEVHAELQTQSKMFCACPVVDSTSAAPNSATCEICTGMPGTLPVINARAVEYGLRVALALHATPAEHSSFARKNYFYPDLPKGYQISQYELPLAEGGWLEIQPPAGARRVRIRRVHLEEDTGKLFHRQGHTLIDYNRSGVALLEIVSEPDLHSLEEVKAYATELRSVLRTLGVNSGDMEKGVIRFEANVSLRRAGASVLGTRTEIKNLNSFRSMLRAVAFEMDRQARLLRSGQPVRQETVGWNEATGETFSQRGKEEAHDYRYFAEPDLPSLRIEPSLVESVRVSLPELPSERRARWQREFGLTPSASAVLGAEPADAAFFEAAVRSAPQASPQHLAHWMAGELYGLLHASGLSLDACRVTPSEMAELVTLVDSGRVTAASGKAVLAEMFASGDSAATVVERRGLQIVDDTDEIARLVRQVLESHPEQLAQYLSGKASIGQWFFGQVMRLAGGRAEPARVQQALQESLRSAENHHAGL